MVDLAIIGCGAVTPLGYDRSSSVAAVRSGIDATVEHPFMTDRFGEPMKVMRVPCLNDRLFGPERLTELITRAAQAALEPLLSTNPFPEITLILSLGEPRPGQDKNTASMVAGSLCEMLDRISSISQVTHWMGGHAGSITGMEKATQLIFDGKAEIVLICAVDSYMNPETLEWLDEIEQLRSEKNIYGFCPSEAAGAVVVTSYEKARQLDIKPLIGLASVASSVEKSVIKSEDICLGRALASVFDSVGSALLGGETIDRILCDMNGERYRGNEFGFAVLKNPGLFENAAKVETPADCWGDIGAASGLLHVCLIVESEARGRSAGPLSLIWASSEAGPRSAAIFRGAGGVHAV